MSYNKFESSTYRKLISNYKLGSVLVQFTYLAFPLSMYIVYNKIISAKNPNALIIIILFLLIVLALQLALKIITSIQKTILDTNLNIKNHQKIISKNINQDASLFVNNEHTAINEIYTIPKNNEKEIQTQVITAYYLFVLIYFGLIITVGGFIFLIPLTTFSINYLVVKQIGMRYKICHEQYIQALDKKNIFIKEMLLKMKAIKGMNISEKIVKKYDTLSFHFNKYRYDYMHLSNLSTRVTVALNIITMSFMVIFGRYLFSIGYMTIEEVVTCSILTVWISRSLVQIFANIANNNIEHKHELEEFIKPQQSYDLSKIFDYEKQQYHSVKEKLKSEAIIIIDSQLNLKKIYKLLLSDNLQASYVNLDFKILYGSVIQNITLFDETREAEARVLASKLGIDKFITSLPYQYNYVLSNQYDEALTTDVGLFVSIVRELLIEPDYLVIDTNISDINSEILTNLISYCRDKNIKLICKKITYKISEDLDNNSEKAPANSNQLASELMSDAEAAEVEGTKETAASKINQVGSREEENNNITNKNQPANSDFIEDIEDDEDPFTISNDFNGEDPWKKIGDKGAANEQ